MHSLSSLIPKVLNKYNLASEARAALILETAKKHAVQIFGSNCLDSVCFKKYRNGVIFAHVKSASWAQELYLQAETILEKIKKSLPDSAVKKIRIVQRELFT